MAKVRQSPRPDSTGWLLEIGVIGIDRTLLLIKLLKYTPQQLESLFRPWLNTDLKLEDKQKLPWIEIDPDCFVSQKNKKMIQLQNGLKPWLDYLKDEEIRKGRKLTPDEMVYFERNWKEIASWYPKNNELEQSPECFHYNKKIIKPNDSLDVKSLYTWRLNRERFNLIMSEEIGWNRNRFNRIKAHSRILWDIIQVLKYDWKAMPVRYSDKTVQKQFRLNREKIEEIIDESLIIINTRRSKISELSNQLYYLKRQLELHDKKRVSIVEHLNYLNLEFKDYCDGKNPKAFDINSLISMNQDVGVHGLESRIKSSKEELKRHDLNRDDLLFKLSNITDELQEWNSLRL